jgi:hypothetical protein
MLQIMENPMSTSRTDPNVLVTYMVRNYHGLNVWNIVEEINL